MKEPGFQPRHLAFIGLNLIIVLFKIGKTINESSLHDLIKVMCIILVGAMTLILFNIAYETGEE